MIANQWRAAAAFEEALTAGMTFAEYNGSPTSYDGSCAGSRTGAWTREENPRLRWKMFPMTTESHHSSTIRCLHEGLQWIFRGFKP